MAKIYSRRYLKSQRASGYKSTAWAISELVDNAFDALAPNVEVIFIEKKVRGKPQIDQIAVCDNGIGMSKKTVEICLAFGESLSDDAHLKTKKRIGAFGVGLPQASQSQCTRFEVFSWQNKVTYNNYFDYDCEDFLNAYDNNSFPEVTANNLPNEISSLMENYNENNGTVILWSGCDEVKPKGAQYLLPHCEKLLGRIYRYKLEDGSCNINFTIARKNEDGKIIKQGNSTQCKPFDPLFLMENTITAETLYKHANIQGIPKESYAKFAISEAKAKPTSKKVKEFCGQYSFKYSDKIFHYEMKTSIGEVDIRHPGTKNGGALPVGKLYEKKMQDGNIYFVRSGREIMSGSFGEFYKLGVPENRWFGIEISFNNDMDKLFGLSNNKQNVTFTQTVDDPGELGFDNDIRESEASDKLHYELSQNIAAAIKKAKSVAAEDSSEWYKSNLIDPTEPDSPGGIIGPTPDVPDIIVNVEPKIVDHLNPNEEKELYILIKEMFPNASHESINKRIRMIDNTGVPAYIFYTDIPDSDQLYVYNKIGLGGLHIIKINTSHSLYSRILHPLQASLNNQSNATVNILTALELFISALVIEEQKLVQREEEIRIIEKHRKFVAMKLEDFITTLFEAYPNIEDEIINMGNVTDDD